MYDRLRIYRRTAQGSAHTENMTQEQLADYLCVERSGLSLELGKMRDEGLLDFHKSHFILKV